MKNRLLMTISTTAFLAVASQAQLVTVELGGHTSTPTSTSVMYSYMGGGPTTSFATAYNASVDGFNFMAYCVDLSAGAAVNSSYLADRESVLTFLPGSVGQRLAYIYNNHHNAGLTADQQASVQVALWEARYDMDFDLNSGNFKAMAINSGVKSGAEAILANVMNPTGPIGDAYYFESQINSQDLIGPVPEPASLAALGVGAAALIRRRKNRK